MNRSTGVLAFLITAQAALLFTTFQHWNVVGAGVLLLIALVCLVQRLRPTSPTKTEKKTLFDPTRSFWVLMQLILVGALSVAWRSYGMMDDFQNIVAVVADTLAHFCFLSSLLLWIHRPSRGHLLMPFFGLGLVLLCAASGGVSRSLQSQTTAGVLACLGFVMATRAIFGDRSMTTANLSKASRGSRRVALVATAIVMMMMTGAIANVTNRILPDIQDGLQKHLQTTIEVVERNRMTGGMRYVRGSRLGSIRRHLLQDPQAVVLNIYADQSPGYLRGTVFDLCRDSSRWQSAGEQLRNTPGLGEVFVHRMVEPLGPATVSLESREQSELNRFQLLPQDSSRISKLEIVSDPTRGNNVFLPLGTRWIEAGGNTVAFSKHQSVIAGIDNRQPYVVGAADLCGQIQLSPGERWLLTYLSPDQTELLRPIARQVCGRTTSPIEKATAISKYFQTNFQYGLEDVKRPSDADPLSYFMTQRHPAHCEFFATATTLMLRAVDVPSRYVVGYVSDEESENIGRWLARNRDAHAWAEAYDDQTKRWFPVESTPGRTYKTVFASDALTNSSEATLLGEDESLFQQRGWLSYLRSYIASFRTGETFFTLYRYSQLALLIGLVGWLVRRLQTTARSPDEVAERAGRRMLARVESQLARSGFIRSSGETLHQFSDRVQHAVAQMDNQMPAHRGDARSSSVGSSLTGSSLTGSSSTGSSSTGEASSTPADQVTTANQHKRGQIHDAAVWIRQFAEARYQGKVPTAWSG